MGVIPLTCRTGKMTSRQLRNRITIQSGTANTNGNPGLDWSSPTTVHATRAHKKPARGNERQSGSQVVAIRGTVYTIRYVDGITPQMRVKDGSLVRNITYVNVDMDNGRQEWLELHCLEDAG